MALTSVLSNAVHPWPHLGQYAIHAISLGTQASNTESWPITTYLGEDPRRHRTPGSCLQTSDPHEQFSTTSFPPSFSPQGRSCVSPPSDRLSSMCLGPVSDPSAPRNS